MIRLMIHFAFQDDPESEIRVAPLTDVHTGEVSSNNRCFLATTCINGLLIHLWKQVWKHIVRRVGKKSFHQCMYCSREFRRPSDLVRHVRMHTQSRPFK